MGHVWLKYSGSPVSIHQCFIHVFIYSFIHLSFIHLSTHCYRRHVLWIDSDVTTYLNSRWDANFARGKVDWRRFRAAVNMYLLLRSVLFGNVTRTLRDNLSFPPSRIRIYEPWRWTNRLSRNVGKELPLRWVISQKSTDLIWIAGRNLKSDMYCVVCRNPSVGFLFNFSMLCDLFTR
jgi:hypothetical protein